MLLRDATEADLPALLDIHNNAVRTLAAVWSAQEDSFEDRQNWFRERKAADFPIIVMEDEAGDVVAYGSYGRFRGRDGYDLTIEHSVYVAPKAQGNGIGKTILQELIEIAKRQGYHVLVGAIDGGNAASIGLHKAFGFEEVGHMPQVGKKFGRWLDLALLTLILDDRDVPPADK